jgi:amino acid transporter
MSRHGELPAFVGRGAPRTGVPRNAVLIGGAVMFVLAFSSDLPHIAYISSFSVLLYYAALNLSGLKVLRGPVRLATAAGFLSCLVLMFSLPKLSWLVGVAAVLLGAAFYGVRTAALKRRSMR